MSTASRNLTSDPSAERIAERRPSDEELRAADPRSGGDPAHAPRSLLGVEQEPDDEPVASNDDWDDPARL